MLLIPSSNLLIAGVHTLPREARAIARVSVQGGKWGQ